MSKPLELKLEQTMTYFDALQILRLIKYSEQCESVSVEFGDMKLSFTRVDREAQAAIQLAAAAELTAPALAAPEPEPPVAAAAVSVAAPMVGFFHRSPAPDAPAFVQIGDEVEESDTVGLIKAVDLCKPVIAGVAGRVTEILVDNAAFVEYGQEVMLIKPVY